jgi:hypothetical protein
VLQFDFGFWSRLIWCLCLIFIGFVVAICGALSLDALSDQFVFEVHGVGVFFS